MTESSRHQDIDPAWVEAGVKALKDTWAEGADTVEDFAAAVIAAVAPLIREQIAAEIEALPIDHRSPGRANVSGLVTFARREAYLRAAAIARGGAR